MWKMLSFFEMFIFLIIPVWFPAVEIRKSLLYRKHNYRKQCKTSKHLYLIHTWSIFIAILWIRHLHRGSLEITLNAPWNYADNPLVNALFNLYVQSNYSLTLIKTGEHRKVLVNLHLTVCLCSASSEIFWSNLLRKCFYSEKLIKLKTSQLKIFFTI